jgi:hypothetical protein
MSKKASSLVDTRVVYCGNNLEQLTKLPAAWTSHPSAMETGSETGLYRLCDTENFNDDQTRAARRSTIGRKLLQQCQSGLEIALQCQRPVCRRPRSVVLTIARQDHCPHVRNMRVIGHACFRVVEGP